MRASRFMCGQAAERRGACAVHLGTGGAPPDQAVLLVMENQGVIRATSGRYLRSKSVRDCKLRPLG